MFKLVRLFVPRLQKSTNIKFAIDGIKTFCTTKTNCSLARVLEEDGIRKIILSNSKTRNALSLEMMDELIEHITADKQTTRCVVISAEGNVFSSGHNLKELIIKDNECSNAEVFSRCSDLMKSIITAPVPVIAAVNGAAVAAGCQLVAQCDIAVCTNSSSFATPGSRHGIFCSTPGIPLVRAVPRKIAAQMLMTGVSINADEALRYGLVSNVVPDADLDSEVNKLCDAIKYQSKSVVALGKQFFYQQLEMDLTTAYKLGEKVMTENSELVDGQEGVRSFAEKRKPLWKHNFEKA